MEWKVPVQGGELPVVADDTSSRLVVVLAHGAGSHMDHRTMLWLSNLLRELDVSVVRFNFLYRVLGKPMPDRMPLCAANYREVIDSVRERCLPEKLVIGGHSFGGRVASMVEAERKMAEGLLLFGYPLHPPGQPTKLRDEHLRKILTPTLQVNGTEDEFCTKTIMEEIVARLDPDTWTMNWIEGANHSYSVRKSSGRTKKDAESDIRSAIRSWLKRFR